MESASATHHPPVEGQCPRCGTHVSDLSRRCRECLLQLQPGDEEPDGRTTMLRRVWEQEHPEATEAFEHWAVAPEGAPPGVTNPVHPPGPPVHPLEPWQPLEGRMKRVVVVLAALAVLSVVAIIADVMELSLLSRADRGEPVAQSEWEATDSRTALIGILQVVLTVTAAVVFVMWFFRAYQNIGAIRVGVRRYALWWTIFGWFIPIMAWFRPKQIANDLWAAGAKDESDAQPGFLLAAWWGLFIISSVISRFIFRSWDAEETDELIGLTQAYIAADAVDAVGAVLAIMVVTRITRRMKARHEELSTPAVSPPAQEAALPA